MSCGTLVCIASNHDTAFLTPSASGFTIFSITGNSLVASSRPKCVSGEKALPTFIFSSSKAPPNCAFIPASVLAMVPSILLNFPPSPVASLNACCTISKVMLPCDISSFRVPMLLPVRFDISSSGLKPALMSCSRSCPCSLPAERICEKANVSELSFSASPIDTSPNIRRLSTTSVSLKPKPSIVCAFLNTSVPRMVFCCRSTSSLVSFPPAALLPVSTSNETCNCCLSNAACMVLPMAEPILEAALIAVDAAPRILFNPNEPIASLENNEEDSPAFLAWLLTLS